MYHVYYHSPIGILEIKSDGRSVIGLNFVEKAGENQPCPVLELALGQIDEYFHGHRRDFDLPLDLDGTDFQKKVWAELRKIPYGETRSYGELADSIGNKNASRAVGMANNRNPIGIIVPCHRVIGKNGSMIGYAGGLEKKEWLVRHEAIFETTPVLLNEKIKKQPVIKKEKWKTLIDFTEGGKKEGIDAGKLLEMMKKIKA
ncbi:MAG: methylated-DNA-[protein]-cysteine S-methyltransferase [Parcubacteria group bacterium Gr01-1014_18]|nr:MAG: methylated-DNA-[protein]-cysteine S-methyltransferase [Parcubacteria group bacterium Greene0416_36]TSC81195.1 MAG: methylated-DNA-[protein]-cysteine S-methyltransferase [Parcubacteria group bacterium Gr01-1014_18]TSC99192.1 MAG: methylated-DNA-[protein]-cysteine S-methyltransferase [Parcubacteria group bacterium Greene1014_20]TSD07450.1 MAG: methylated-DNA-[protein]-cysteine S-methyltransferase [Parcubacteria group bacterium Greene0714_2]